MTIDIPEMFLSNIIFRSPTVANVQIVIENECTFITYTPIEHHIKLDESTTIFNASEAHYEA